MSTDRQAWVDNQRKLAEADLMTYQFGPGMQKPDPLSELLGAEDPEKAYIAAQLPPLLAEQHEAGFRDWMRDTMSGDFLPGGSNGGYAQADPASYPYKELLREYNYHKTAGDPEYAAILRDEIDNRLQGVARAPEEVKAAMRLLHALDLNETAPWFNPDISEFLNRPQVMDAPGDRDQWDFTGSPETQYHHKHFAPDSGGWGAIRDRYKLLEQAARIAGLDPEAQSFLAQLRQMAIEAAEEERRRIDQEGVRTAKGEWHFPVQGEKVEVMSGPGWYASVGDQGHWYITRPDASVLASGRANDPMEAKSVVEQALTRVKAPRFAGSDWQGMFPKSFDDDVADGVADESPENAAMARYLNRWQDMRLNEQGLYRPSPSVQGWENYWPEDELAKYKASPAYQQQVDFNAGR